MALSLWFALRQAREALRIGQPEQARQLIQPFVQLGYRKAFVVQAEIAQAYLQIGRRALEADNVELAWQNLIQAETLDPNSSEISNLRSHLTRLATAQTRALLEAGRPTQAIDLIARFKQRQANPEDLNWIESLAQDWIYAAELADRGEFAAAIGVLDRAPQNLAEQNLESLHLFHKQLEDRQKRFLFAFDHVQQSHQEANWKELLRWSDDILSVAPNHRASRNLKAKAWEALQPNGQSSLSNNLTQTRAFLPKKGLEEIQQVHGGSASENGAFNQTRHYAHSPEAVDASAVAVRSQAVPKRFLIWIDGVGGYLVCMAPTITIGQATSHGSIDIPLFADVSRLHAEIARDSGGYVLESGRGVNINGQEILRHPLKCGDRITLGRTCQLLFHQPVPISPSARLEIVSGHRIPIAVDGILLMAENLIFGPSQRSHVAVQDLHDPLIIYRQDQELHVQHNGHFRIDNQPYRDTAPLTVPCHFSSDSLSFAIEELSI